jgi:hypothetical protein
MKNVLRKDHRGLAHLAIPLVILVVAAVGVAGWFVFQKMQDSKLSPQEKVAKTAIKDAKCTGTTDKDLCKFFKAMTATSFTSMRTSMTSDGKTTTITLLSDGNNAHMTMTSEGTSWEIISIGTTTYTKAGSTWYKKVDAATAANTTGISSSLRNEIKEPTANSTNQPAYKQIGKEKCGDLTCFKYQVTEASDEAGTKNYMWFDTKTFLLRRAQQTGGTAPNNSTIGYDKTTIAVPSPVKDLTDDQYIMPGATEPTTIPSTTDLSTDTSI